MPYYGESGAAAGASIAAAAAAAAAQKAAQSVQTAVRGSLGSRIAGKAVSAASHAASKVASQAYDPFHRSGRPYVPPTAWESWKVRRDEELAAARKRSIFDEQEDPNVITSLGGLLGMPTGIGSDKATTALDKRKKMAKDIFDKRDAENFQKTLTPEAQERNDMTRRRTVGDLSMKSKVIADVERLQAADPTLPAEERQYVAQLSNELKYGVEGGKYTEDNPIVVQIRNMGTRSQFRKMLSDWKAGKSGGDALPLPLPGGLDINATGEEIDNAGGLGGFLNQANGKGSDYDSTPSRFGYVINKNEDGVDSIMRAEDWINAKMTDLMPAPGDTQEERDRKGAEAADLISTLAFADKYASFAKKRDAGYRIQLDAAGNPIKAYIANDDKVALQNLLNDVLAMQEGGVIAPVEDFMKAYADERRGIAEDATGPYGDGSSSGGSGGGGYYRSYGGGYGGGGYGGGGGGGQQAYQTDAELLKVTVDGIARARMGRSLTAEESMAFIEHFHQIEAAVYANGGTYTKFDPEAQAVAWIESQMVKESAGQQGGKMMMALANFFKTGTIS